MRMHFSALSVCADAHRCRWFPQGGHIVVALLMKRPALKGTVTSCTAALAPSP